MSVESEEMRTVNATCSIRDTRPTVPADDTEPYYGQRAQLTTEHPASSYGLPVLVYDGQPIGPADLPAWTELDSILADADADDLPPEYAGAIRDLEHPYWAWCGRQQIKTAAAQAAAIEAGYRVAS